LFAGEGISNHTVILKEICQLTWPNMKWLNHEVVKTKNNNKEIHPVLVRQSKKKKKGIVV